MMLKDLKEYLIADAGITAKVGRRINYGKGVQRDTAPYVVMTTVSEPSRTFRVIARPRIQISVYADTYAGADTIKELIISRLDTARGTMGSTGVVWIKHSDTRYKYDDETGLHGFDVDVFVRYRT